ncbi:hypothetical protein MYAM1_002067 [Malassezia yamatoensis]|uniref:SWI/SNF and RSC complexes subunit Ssr4 C-terminal domain-containing protein n=1 Tax=Malassezia yamatoensis TaxID=253288 RepID=A0AAJ5YU70_9BASI|nr:hypothetical protein MYAM1_002067 [Malassezia yamatoensis]
MRTGETGVHVPSTRGRKRKNPLLPSTWDPANAARNNMPRASSVQGGQTIPVTQRPYYNLVFGTEPDEDIADALVALTTDTLDVVTPRDLATARYARNHELLERILGPGRLDTMHAPPSPYEHTNPEHLRAELKSLKTEIQEIDQDFAHRSNQWRNAESNQEDVDDHLQDWEVQPSQGAILGIGHIRASPSPEIASQINARRTTAAAPPSSEIREAIQKVNQNAGVSTTPAQAFPPGQVPGQAIASETVEEPRSPNPSIPKREDTPGSHTPAQDRKVEQGT